MGVCVNIFSLKTTCTMVWSLDESSEGLLVKAAKIIDGHTSQNRGNQKVDNKKDVPESGRHYCSGRNENCMSFKHVYILCR